MQTGTATASPGASSSSLAGLGGTSTSVSKEEFLKLLVTQLRLQNPLEPLGNEEFVAQLAQFGALEEMQNVRTATETNTRLMGSVNNAVATSFIGREAIVASSAFAWTGEGELDLGVDLPAPGRATVRMYDEHDLLVRSFDVASAEGGPVLVGWDGRDGAGRELPAGTYRLEVVASDASGAAMLANPVIAGIVQGVTFVNGASYLSVNGTRVPLATVLEINA